MISNKKTLKIMGGEFVVESISLGSAKGVWGKWSTEQSGCSYRNIRWIVSRRIAGGVEDKK
jgi:hypothetical protein